MKTTKPIITAALFTLLVGAGLAQSDAPAPPTGNQQDGSSEPRRRPDVMGKITAISGQTLTVQSPDGRNITVTVTDSTRITKERQPAKLADFKVGDMAMIRGRSTGTDTWEADSLGSRGSGPGGPRGFGQGGFAQDLGKKFIAGEIKAIDGTHLTIARIDGETQTIAVDENTSFKKENESITLADFKVGDRVFGPGELKSGTFVASRLMLGDLHRMHGGPEDAPGPDQK